MKTTTEQFSILYAGNMKLETPKLEQMHRMLGDELQRRLEAKARAEAKKEGGK